jgi:hypothetical protein
VCRIKGRDWQRIYPSQHIDRLQRQPNYLYYGWYNETVASSCTKKSSIAKVQRSQIANLSENGKGSGHSTSSNNHFVAWTIAISRRIAQSVKHDLQ